MKKALWIVVLAVLASALTLLGQSITMTSPTANSDWCKGSTYTITWTKSGAMPDTVKIRLRRAGAPETEASVWAITDSTANDGSFGTAAVPASVPAGNYFIRVRTIGDPDVIGNSGVFHIATCTQTITVTTPSADWCIGTGYTINWTKSGTMPDTVKIRLRRAGAPETEASVWAITDSTANDGSFGTAAVPASVPAGNYFIRVRTIGDPDVIGDSQAFKIVAALPPPPPASVLLKLKWPNGGENLILHRDYTISWESIASDTVGKVQLDLMIYKKETEQWMIGVIAGNLPATGSYVWKAGEYPGNTAGAGQYRIRVRSMTSNDHSDSSDSPFRLSLLMKGIGKSPRLIKPVSLPGIYQNYPHSKTFPSGITPPVPLSVFQQGWQQMFASGCGQVKQTAKVGAFWFPYQYIKVASIYRSRIRFSLSQFAGQGAKLKSARLKMKRIYSVHEDANSACGCGENLWVLEAPMTSQEIPAIGQRIDVSLGTAEFSRDVTGIVRQWLDGALANNGLVLLAKEAPCSGGRTCASCYEATLVLDIQ